MTIISKLAKFSEDCRYDSLPANVMVETKRIVLDSIGCAIAGVEQLKGKAGIEYGRLIGGQEDSATIIGTKFRSSVTGAAFANGELFNAIDMDCVVPPGHVSPYVLPGALAIGEAAGSSGKSLIAALAVAHEMSYRIGKATDNLRDTRDNVSAPPKVFGYSSTIFGATAAIGMLKSQPQSTISQALGIAGCISPVNYQMSWYQHPPYSTLKYLVGGVIAQQAHVAAHLAELGHQGDTQILDDREWGYPKFIGTTKWEPEHIVKDLGDVWNFPAVTSFKPYAHCRIMHASFDCIYELVEEHGLNPREIDGIKVYVEGFAEQPIWLNRNVTNPNDAQFSMAHGIAMAAHRPMSGREWMDSELIFSESVMSLMSRVETEVHPDYVKLLTKQGASRPAWVEIKARGTSFVREKRYPKGSPSPEPESYMSDDELIAKFCSNAEVVLTKAKIDEITDRTFDLENVDDIGTLMRLATAS